MTDVKIYPVGLHKYNYLTISGDNDVITHSEEINDDESIIFECNTKDKTMIEYSYSKQNNKRKQVYSESDVIRKKICLDNSYSWEGDTINEIPFGYGNYYQNGSLIYTGFMENRRKICYGSIMDKNTSCVKYKGSFYNNERFGYGRSYISDKESDYEGEWVNDKKITTIDTKAILRDKSDVYFCIKEVFITNTCGNVHVVYLKDFHNLEKLEIEDGSFKDTTQFKISRCNNLESIRIGNGCCNDNMNCSFSKCESLKDVIIGSDSFKKSCLKMKSIA